MTLEDVILKGKAIGFEDSVVDDPEAEMIVDREEWQEWSHIAIYVLKQSVGEDSDCYLQFKSIMEYGQYQCNESTFRSALGLIKAAASIHSEHAKTPNTVEEPNFKALLHPVIIDSSYKQLANNDYRSAVLNGVIGLFDFIRKKSAVDKDGEPLIDEVLSLNNPVLVLSDLTSESGKNDQLGFMGIMKGTFKGIRNPKAHTLTHDLNEIKTKQYLVFLSLLARRIDEARNMGQPVEQ